MGNLKKRIVVFSGAGISAESGLKTFRDSGGLWENYRIEDVATPEAWSRNPELVLKFYCARLDAMHSAQPNEAHLALAALEEYYDVDVITQNVDDLHERAGSKSVLHLHGELAKCRSTGPSSGVYEMPFEGLKLGDLCPDGHQLRPHIVWFGEAVPAIDGALDLIRNTEELLIIGTSLNVYPAAGLAFSANDNTRITLIDPGTFTDLPARINHIKKPASEGMQVYIESLRDINF